MVHRLGVALLGFSLGVCAQVNAAELLRFQPPLGHAQDFDVVVDGSATARGKDINFNGYLDLTQLITEVPEDPAEPLTLQLTLNGGEIHYNDKTKPPRYVGDPLTAHRARLGMIMDVSQPLDDDDETGIDVTAAVLYASSLLVFPERETRPGATWDGSHEAYDPFGEWVDVTAKNRFADLLELPDRTMAQVDSEGHFRYKAKIDNDELSGLLQYYLEMTVDLATGALLEADLVLYGELKATAVGPITVGIKVHKLHVHIKQRSERLLTAEELRAARASGSDEGTG